MLLLFVVFVELVMWYGSVDLSDGNLSGECEMEDETRRAGAVMCVGLVLCLSDDFDDEGDGDDGLYYGIDWDGVRDFYLSDDDGERDERGE